MNQKEEKALRESIRYLIQHVKQKRVDEEKELRRLIGEMAVHEYSLLEKKGIGTSINYPIPIHLQPSSQFLGYKASDFPITEEQAKHILTIPIHQFLSKMDIQTIARSINEFFEGNMNHSKMIYGNINTF